MTKPYDITAKELIELDPAAWTALLGRPDCTVVEMVDADLSTVSAAADKVIRVVGPPAWILHLEFQSSRDDSIPVRLLRYNAMLRARHGLPVASAVVLLRPIADGPNLTGELITVDPLSARPQVFPYTVTRLWTMPPEPFLAAGLGAVPFAMLADIVGADLPNVANRVRDRIAVQSPGLAATLFLCTSMLMGLRYDLELIESLALGVRTMEESVVYQDILRRGEVQGLAKGFAQSREYWSATAARHFLERIGKRRFGQPDARSEAAMASISDLDTLEQLGERVFEVSTWSELLTDVKIVGES